MKLNRKKSMECISLIFFISPLMSMQHEQSPAHRLCRKMQHIKQTSGTNYLQLLKKEEFEYIFNTAQKKDFESLFTAAVQAKKEMRLTFLITKFPDQLDIEHVMLAKAPSLSMGAKLQNLCEKSAAFLLGKSFVAPALSPLEDLINNPISVQETVKDFYAIIQMQRNTLSTAAFEKWSQDFTIQAQETFLKCFDGLPPFDTMNSKPKEE